VLMALVVASIFTTVDAQRQSNTEANMRTVMQTLTKHWKFVVDQASKESPSLAAKILAGGSIAANGDDANLQRAQIIWIKLRLMEAFPMTYAEINDPSAGGVARVYQNTPFPPNVPWIPVDAGRRYMGTYQRVSKLKSAANDPLTEPSACLLMSLSIARGGNKLEADTLGPSIIRDTDSDGIPEIADNWGRALAFFRFPAGNLANPGGNDELQRQAPNYNKPYPPSPQSYDPLDASGKLLSVNWFNKQLIPPPQPLTTCGDFFNLMFHPLNPDPNPPNSLKYPYNPRNYYIVPVLVSAGRDGQFGLDNFMCVLTPQPDYDNVYSFRLRLGARGD